MQLTSPTHKGRISAALGLLTANLLTATAAHAQIAPAPVFASAGSTADSDGNDDLGSDLGKTRIDSTVLFYQEAGGRVKATEPVVSATLNDDYGDVLSVKLTSDIVTGATPNGAAPWSQPQTFTTPAHAPGTKTTVTSASGNSTIVTLPGSGTVARQYTTPANTLPVDAGFRDARYALDVGYSVAWNPDLNVSTGLSASTERDYASYSISAGFAQSFDQKRTTASLGLNFEYDQSKPNFGTPTPFTVMTANLGGPDKSKTVVGLVAGVTEVVNRYWLAQLNYSVGTTNGYQTDPYRIISVVDGTTGAPQSYLYESRPDNRLRQSLYFGNKIALGPTFADISVRGYHDSWGIDSVTVDVSDRIPLGTHLYLEPQYRYYDQTAATFFRDYLISGAVLPAYASSDSRLGKFSANTEGLKIGYRMPGWGELYLEADHYKQSGQAHPAGVVPGLASQNLFSGISANSLIVGYSFAFR
jgi:hypothetical protein